MSLQRKQREVVFSPHAHWNHLAVRHPTTWVSPHVSKLRVSGRWGLGISAYTKLSQHFHPQLV